MLFKHFILASLASLAFASPGGDYDYNDKDWGKSQCYTKYVTYYETKYNYKTETYNNYATKTDEYYYTYTSAYPTTYYKTFTETKYKTEVETYPVTKTESWPYTYSQVESEVDCKTKWDGKHWDYN